MEVETLEVLDFLQQHPPFSVLSLTDQQQVAAQVEISYFKAGTQILALNQVIDALYLVRSGSVEVFRRSGVLYNRLTEGGYFGEFALLRNKLVIFPVRALEDCLIYRVPEAVFTALYDEHEDFADAVEAVYTTRLHQAAVRASGSDADELMAAPASSLITREPVTVTPETSVQEAACLLNEAGVSSLMVVDPQATGSNGLLGIITDRDIRSRLVAAGLDYTTPVREIMSTDLVSIDQQRSVFEAQLLMLRHNLHHLPITQGPQLLGLIGISDIIRYESQNSLFIVRSIFRQQSVDDLQALSRDVRACFVRLVNDGMRPANIGRAMALIGRSFKQRLLELAEEQLGPPPVPYCFLALGSMARQEQLIVTDQDNALILDDRFDAATQDGYFAELARFVSDGLDACGYSYCKGGIMATNPRWRQPLQVWKQIFSDWIERPSPESLLNSSIFFDLEGVFGKTQWAEVLKQLIAGKAKKSPHFLSCMAHNALNRTPPLGFFRDFVLEPDGRQRLSINMKARGTAPVADLIRVHALALGCQEQNSFDRLQAIIEAGLLPPGRGQDLRDALELISGVRIRHQALSLESGEEPDNQVIPDRLSDFERRSLKDAFQLLSHAQKFMKYRYPPVGNRGSA